MTLDPATAASPHAPIHHLFRAHGASVRHWARRFARSASDADDIVQEVFLVVHRHADSVATLNNPQGWLLRVTVNVARHYWRSQARQTRRELAWDNSATEQVAVDPLAEIEAKEVARRIRDVLATLDPRSAEIYRLAEVEQMSTTAISALTGLSPVTVRVRRFRTRSVIARRLALPDRAGPAALDH